MKPKGAAGEGWPATTSGAGRAPPISLEKEAPTKENKLDRQTTEGREKT